MQFYGLVYSRNLLRDTTTHSAVPLQRGLLSDRKSGHVSLFGARLQRVKALMVCEPIDGVARRRAAHTTGGRRTFSVLLQRRTRLPWHTFLTSIYVTRLHRVHMSRWER